VALLIFLGISNVPSSEVSFETDYVNEDSAFVNKISIYIYTSVKVIY
jgi:hypothetical protein